MANQFISISEISQKSQNTHSRELIPGQWNEGQIILLHNSKAITKLSTAASMIHAVNLHDTHRQILYIDAENNASTLAEYLAEDTHISKIPLSVYRPTFDDDTLTCDYADLVISAIETAVKETEIRTFVVDSINRIAAASFGRNASPVHIMKKLVALQMRYGISLLVIAHTDSRSTREALIALSDKDFYATLPQTNIQLPPTKPSEHTPSQSSEHTLSSNPTTMPVEAAERLRNNQSQRQLVGADAEKIRPIPSAEVSESSDTSDLSDLSAPSDNSQQQICSGYHQPGSLQDCSNDSRGLGNALPSVTDNDKMESELRSNHRLRERMSRDAGEASRRSWIAVGESQTDGGKDSIPSDSSEHTPSDLGFSINPDLPRAERRRLQKAAQRLQRLR